MACADVATAKAKEATAINLIIVSSHMNLQEEIFWENGINSAHVQPVSTRLPEAKSHTEGASVTAICRRIGPACYESLGLTTKAEPANERYNERDARRADWFLQPKDTLTRFCF